MKDWSEQDSDGMLRQLSGLEMPGEKKPLVHVIPGDVWAVIDERVIPQGAGLIVKRGGRAHLRLRVIHQDDSEEDFLLALKPYEENIYGYCSECKQAHHLHWWSAVGAGGVFKCDACESPVTPFDV